MGNAARKINFNSLSKKDPTRTATLRARFSADMTRRFKNLRRVVIKAVVDEDVFGLKEETPQVSLQVSFLEKVETPGQVGKWKYRSHTDKVDEFMEWLREQERKEILELIYDPTTMPYGAGRVPWINTYIQTAYQKGFSKARADLEGSGLERPDVPPAGIEPELNVFFNRPFHASRIEPIFSRVFTDLEGVTSAMETQMARVLSLGLAQGKNPSEIARDLAERVDKIGITRANLIARTETIRTYNIGSLNEYEVAERVTETLILIRWVTALDERVRVKHRAWHGRIYTRGEAMGMIGEPNCRCATVPFIPEIHGVDKESISEEAAKKIKKEDVKRKERESNIRRIY